MAKLRSLIFYFLLISFSLSCFTGCFTGIESTKKINLSREDKKNIKPSDEEIFYGGIPGYPVKEWKEGKEFLVTDNKALLVFEPLHIPFNFKDIDLEGKIIQYSGKETRIDAAGNNILTINFKDSIFTLPYNTGKPVDQAMSDFTSSQIPMLIDLQMVEEANQKLRGLKLWTRTFLWYDVNGERINGKKFVPVTIIEVLPGNMVFPFKLKIKDENNEIAYMYMNAGISPTDSRAFHHLFSLTDIRHNYHSINDNIWDLICKGEITSGMTKEECRLALGNPKEISAGHDYSRTLDIWNYENGTVLWFEDGILSRYRK